MNNTENKKTEMERREKKFSYSKLQVLITGTIFILCVLFVIYLYMSGSISDAYDTTVIATIVTVSGSIFGSNLCWYSKKAAGENHYKLRMSLYSDSAKVRLEYNENMMKMMKKYGMTQADIDRIDESGDADEMMNDSLSSVVSDLDNIKEDSDSTNTLDSFNNLG